MSNTLSSVRSLIGTGVIAVIAGLFILSAPAYARPAFMKIPVLKGEWPLDDNEGAQLIMQFNEMVPQINAYLDEATTLSAQLAETKAEDHKPGGGATGQSRRRGDVKVEDMSLEEASRRLEELVTLLTSDLSKAHGLLNQAKGLLGKAIEAEEEGTTPETGDVSRGDDIKEAAIDALLVINEAQAAIEEAVTIVGEIGTE